MDSFAASCHGLFDRVALGPGDQLLLPTISEFDLLGLTEYLANDPRSRVADWHMQFHFNIFQGREPDFDSQHEKLLRLQSLFAQALSRVSSHRIHL